MEAEEAEDAFYSALGAGDPDAVRARVQMVRERDIFGVGIIEIQSELAARIAEKLAMPPVFLGHGYTIMDTRPGALNYWRPLYGGNPPRPLAQLRAFEESL